MPVGFGRPDKWEEFEAKFPVFLEKLPDLNKTIEKVVAREGESKRLLDSVVFFLGRLCAEDFSEVVLMCANGYGFGAMRLLRSMFERSVTLAYLVKNPNEVDDFWDYFLVTQRKVLNRLKETVGEAEVEASLGRATMDEVENEFQKVKARFTRGKRLQISWTNKTFEQVVKDAGKEYQELYLACYIMTLLQAHPSASSILNRLENGKMGAISFGDKSNSGIVVWPLVCAHNLVLRVIDLHNDYFKLGLDSEIHDRAVDFLAAGRNESGTMWGLET